MNRTAEGLATGRPEVADPSEPAGPGGPVRPDEAPAPIEPGPSARPRRSLLRRGGKVMGITALAMGLLLVGGIGLGRSIRPDPPPPVPDAARTLTSVPLLGAASLGDIIQNLQERLRAVPDDWEAHATLGLAYVQQAWVTADPSYYPKSEQVLRESLRLHPDGNVDAMTGMAALAAARHDFAGALGWGERARDVNPHNAHIRAVIGDALVELGRYDEGFDAYQEAVDLRPDLSTYARASYAWELQGDLEAATQIMQLAFDAAGTSADRAWATYQLGELAWSQGNLDEAERLYRRSVAFDAAFVPPEAGLAKVAWARGRVDEAVRIYREVVARYPAPEFVIALGDTLASAGRDEEAEQQFALVDAETRLFQANGVNVDLEIALFDAEHGRPQEALATAQEEWARRHSIHVADALAWALHANGRHAEALGYSNQALRLGTKNALFLFHRGVIQHELGRDAAARRDLAAAIELNPYFSPLWADEAAALLSSLGGAP